MKAVIASSLLAYAAIVAADEQVGDHPTLSKYPTTTIIAPSPKWTTSTIYTTSVSTVISCAEQVTACPGKEHTVYTTVTIPLTTTVCPVSTTPVETYPGPPASSVPVETYPASSVPVYTPPASSAVYSSAAPPPPPASSVEYTPAAPTHPAVGTVTSHATHTAPTQAVVTAGANAKRAGGALAAVAVAAALF